MQSEGAPRRGTGGGSSMVGSAGALTPEGEVASGGAIISLQDK